MRECSNCELLTHYPDGSYRCDVSEKIVKLDFCCENFKGGRIKQFGVVYSIMRETKLPKMKRTRKKKT